MPTSGACAPPSNETVEEVSKQANAETELDGTPRECRASNVASFRLAVEHPPWPASSPSIPTLDAQAHGTGSEQELLLPVVEALAALRTSATVLTADAGYHSAANHATLAALEVPALIADPDLRKRDELFADRDHHTSAPDPLHDKSGTAKKSLPLFAPSDFAYDADARVRVVPPGSHRTAMWANTFAARSVRVSSVRCARSVCARSVCARRAPP